MPNMTVSLDQLQNYSWYRAAETVDDLNRGLELAKIDSWEELAHFMSQAAHESAKGRFTKELADGKAYERRTDLGNTPEDDGDGPKYKGAGYLQMTGYHWYKRLADYVGDQRIIDEGVDYVAANYPWQSAAFWWRNNGMKELIANGGGVLEVTHKVNGGENGLAQRQAFYAEWVEKNPKEELIEVEEWAYDFIEQVMGDYWKRMDGNEDVQKATNAAMNALRRATGHKEQ